jgi:DNA-directed RNA polymerase subunit beta'
MYPANTLLDEDAVDGIEAAGIDEVKVRTPLTCDTRYGLCARCYGAISAAARPSTWARRSA